MQKSINFRPLSGNLPHVSFFLYDLSFVTVCPNDRKNSQKFCTFSFFMYLCPRNSIPDRLSIDSCKTDEVNDNNIKL